MDEFVVLCFDNHPDFQDQENKEFYQLMSKDIYPKQLANYIPTFPQCQEKPFLE